MKDALSWMDPRRRLPDGTDAFAIGTEEASGLTAFLNQFETLRSQNVIAVKGQWVGPLTFCLHARDPEGEPLISDPWKVERAFEVFARKVRWQVAKLKACASQVIFFIDEPDLSESGILASMESGEVSAMLARVAEVVREAGALAGLHACGTPSFKHLFGAGFDIVSFEVARVPFEMESFEAELVHFYERGGLFAFGLVPTDRPFETPSLAEIQQTFDALLSRWAPLGLGGKRLTERCFITPSCGLANHTPEGAAERVAFLKEVSVLLRQTYTSQVKFSL